METNVCFLICLSSIFKWFTSRFGAGHLEKVNYYGQACCCFKCHQPVHITGVCLPQQPTNDKLLSSSMLPSEKSLVKLEGWQKFWDEPPMNTQGIYPPNIPWLKTDGPYGLFEEQKKYKMAKGEIRARHLLKPLNTQGIYPPNIPWLKTDGPYGLFEDQQKYKTAKGKIRARQLLKPKIEFTPPPLPTSIEGSLPPIT